MTANSLANAEELIALHHARRPGESRTVKFSHHANFPNLSALDELITGLLMDETGQEDLERRSQLASEDSIQPVLEAHLTAVLRARIFQLAARVVPEFLKQYDGQLEVESLTNTFLRMMFNARDVVFTSREIDETVEAVNLLNQYKEIKLATNDTVIQVALNILYGFTNRTVEETSWEITTQGLVPVATEAGIEFTFVPVQFAD